MRDENAKGSIANTCSESTWNFSCKSHSLSFLYKAVWMLSKIKSKTKSIKFHPLEKQKILKMASLALTTSLPRYGRQLGAMIARNQRSSGVFIPLTRRFQVDIQVLTSIATNIENVEC